MTKKRISYELRVGKGREGLETAFEHTESAADPIVAACPEASKWDGALPASPGESLIGPDSPSAL